MEDPYTKDIQLIANNIDYSSKTLTEKNAKTNGKWLVYLLMITAVALWIVFNIVAIQNYQFPPYPLIIMNLILYFIIAIMTNPNVDERN